MRQRATKMLNLPNFLTLIRILTIPFFLVFLAYHRYSEALAVFIFGGVTDFLDGLAARWMNQQTALGAYLDPVADKLLVFASFVMLGMIDGIPMWLAIVVVSRDALILSGYAVIYLLVEERFPAKPSYIGKCSTFLQLITLGVALLSLHDARLLDALVLDLLVAATTLATVVSGFQYVYRGLMWLQSRAPSITRIG
ncbi:MAG: CDP-alcohol phosphatidyltransferase family protein [Deltaproteobacteria bacterium]|nr:CDP-alcohol phosphatidyltransferase family protein [Deltaproteobacteria bacterium]MBI2182382.1 CDP-alcohol phosphatidyltransferase family protein [Deltaproteobacteria bacterium]MBI2231591.1 CDP-alcohol phosphatidyltransferase family protein [Deltaproteobacteria bacterium]MBI2367408.1 CDP-alcohol phosphatidyltransferase family protein [Deltaproteobacteria bacterium]MBI2534492.1 CDP-alcohol phosphatidyltransferase family protein [Deltaproteobacteria bacterium]